MEKEFDFNDSLYYVFKTFKHRNHAHTELEDEQKSLPQWPVVPVGSGWPVRRVALSNYPYLLRELLQRVLERTPGLQVVPNPLLWPYQQAEDKDTSVNWLILSQTDVPWSHSYALPTIRACNPLAILTISQNNRSVAIQSCAAGEYVTTRMYQDISLQTLLSILRHAPEASPAYAQAGYK